ncbi:hypothetical protein DsansV1_C16g0141191 [Dioscorea sansibarensis]
MTLILFTQSMKTMTMYLPKPASSRMHQIVEINRSGEQQMNKTQRRGGACLQLLFGK